MPDGLLQSWPWPGTHTHSHFIKLICGRPAIAPKFSLKIGGALCLCLHSFRPSVDPFIEISFARQTSRIETLSQELPKVVICWRTFFLSYTLNVVLLIMPMFKLESCFVLYWYFVFFPRCWSILQRLRCFLRRTFPNYFSTFRTTAWRLTFTS